MDSTARRHRIVVGVLLFCLSIEALTLYPVFSVFAVALPVGLFGLNYCLRALVE